MSDPTGGAGRLDHRASAVVAVARRIVRAVRHTLDCQQYLHDRYLEGLGASGCEARALLVNRSSEERDLEKALNAPAISARDRHPAPPVIDA
ncbi:MAG TPA: hypothetical protein VIT41_02665 [Microlunatus sp.]